MSSDQAQVKEVSDMLAKFARSVDTGHLCHGRDSPHSTHSVVDHVAGAAVAKMDELVGKDRRWSAIHKPKGEVITHPAIASLGPGSR